MLSRTLSDNLLLLRVVCDCFCEVLSLSFRMLGLLHFIFIFGTSAVLLLKCIVSHPQFQGRGKLFQKIFGSCFIRPLSPPSFLFLLSLLALPPSSSFYLAISQERLCEYGSLWSLLLQEQ